MPSKKNLSNENKGGRGFGVLDKTDRQFLRPNADTDLLYGEKAVGMFGTSDHPGVVNDK
jgi:hypothetical protein